MKDMIKKNKKIYNQILLILYSSISIITIFMLVLGSASPTTSTIYYDTDFRNIDENWYQLINHQSVTLDNIDSYLDVDKYEPIIIERFLPSDTMDHFLSFSTEHQEVYAYVEDELIYSYEMPSDYALLKTPGSAWHTIPLEESYANKNIRLEFHSNFDKYQILPETIFFLYAGELQAAQAHHIWFYSTMIIFMMILAVISYINSNFWSVPSFRTYSIRLGNMYLSISLWLLTENNLLLSIFPNAIFNYLLSMIIIRIIPILFFYFSITTVEHHYLRLKAINVLLWINLLLTLVLQFNFGISLLDTLNYTYLIFGLGSIFCLESMIVRLYKKYKQYGKIPLDLYIYFARIPFIIGAIAEVYIYFNYEYHRSIKGMHIAISLILYTIVSRLILLKIEANVEAEKNKLEQENTQLQINPIMQQVNAHFLFNALNSISALCKMDAQEADRTIVILSRYMREYMYLVDTKEIVPFSHELSLIRSYLEIEQIRFEDIDFSFSVDREDFYVPPLCIHPLIENAITHGIRSNNFRLTVIIKQVQDHMIISIICWDTYYDLRTINNKGLENIDIENIKKCLKLYQCELNFEDSKSGTRVIISIPLNIKNIDQENKHANNLRR